MFFTDDAYDARVYTADVRSEGAQVATQHPRRTVAGAFKRAFDIVFASAFLLAGFWLFAFLWVGVLVTQGGPAVYRHKRVGRNGREFDCLKFRSMVKNSDKVLADHLRRDPLARAEWERDYKLSNDPRITRFGRFLRRSSLDELPQFWNVLRGDMSIVGPRPVVRNELDKYYGGVAASEYMKIRPGLTGPWQVSGRHVLGYEERVALDVMYARNASFSGDLRLILRTVSVVFTGSGAK
jgi:exopolysaccharide production protein ExoY